MEAFIIVKIISTADNTALNTINCTIKGIIYYRNSIESKSNYASNRNNI